MAQKIRIRIEAYEHRSVEQAGLDIVNSALRTGAKVCGPIRLPTRIERITVLSSPHVDKKAREQYELRTHKRVIYITDPTSKTIDELRNLNLPAGVDIRVKALLDER
jgi:small subunit ribosomal protein S10